jgi:Fe-S-cluster containining protein
LPTELIAPGYDRAHNDNMEESDALEAGICGACGLCCDGSLFSHGWIKPEEAPAARKLSLRVFEEEERIGINLPCPAQRSDMSCSVYAARPSVCVNYRCLLLRRYEAGEVGRDEALAWIAEAHRLVTAVRKLLEQDGAAPGTYIWSTLSDRVQANGGAPDAIEWRRAHQALLLEAAVWRAFVRRHFVAEDQKPPDPPSDESSAKST